jgi:hypothetical protein
MIIELDISANKPCKDIFLTVLCNEVKLAEFPADTSVKTIAYDLEDASADHVLKLVMTGKNSRHTQVDNSGQIIDDVYFSVDRLEFEGLDMREIFCLGHECYTHSFNGSRPEFLDEFYGQLGCNGVVDIRFSTPIFLWLNQHST